MDWKLSLTDFELRCKEIKESDVPMAYYIEEKNAVVYNQAFLNYVERRTNPSFTNDPILDNDITLFDPLATVIYNAGQYLVEQNKTPYIMNMIIELI
jgi:hypothetical protein